LARKPRLCAFLPALKAALATGPAKRAGALGAASADAAGTTQMSIAVAAARAVRERGTLRLSAQRPPALRLQRKIWTV
jgi:hypothetical protein